MILVPRCRHSPATPTRHVGFTLIEMMVVIVLTAMLACVVLTFARPSRSLDRLEQCAETVMTFDRLARQHARGLDTPSQLIYTPGSSTMINLDSTTLKPRGRAFDLPSGFRIERVRVGARRSILLSQSRVGIPCSSRGATPTYAVLVSSDQSISDDASEVPAMRRWIIFIGLSAETMQTGVDADVDRIFGALGVSGGAH